MENSFKTFVNGLTTGLLLQLAIGPVFFFIMNLTLQRTIYDGLIAVLAVTLVDYLYITLAIIGVGKALESKKTRRIFEAISSIILMAFGIIMLEGVLNGEASPVTAAIGSENLASSFISAFFLTISNPITILFFAGIFTAKAAKYDYTHKSLYIFGFSTGLATPMFLGASVILFSLLRTATPTIIIQISNIAVGMILLGYGALAMAKVLKDLKSKKTAK